MFITSDLFEPATSRTCEPHPALELGKRKRNGDDGIPAYERRPFHNPPSFESNATSPYTVYPTTLHHAPSERRPVKQLKRLHPKASLVKSTSHLMEIELDPCTEKQHTEHRHQHQHQHQPQPQPPHAASDLRPCHACRLAPRRRRDLENYLDCERCQERACYICARQCVGGCAKAVCKKCIVEVGREGDSWCLDCYSRHINS